MEASKKQKVLSTLINLVGKEEFGFNELNMVIQDVCPGYKQNSILSQELRDCFGSNIICRREPSPKGHGSRKIFMFTTDSKEVLSKQIDQYVKRKENRLDIKIATKIYRYLEFLPGVDSDFMKKYGYHSIPDLSIINKYSKTFTKESVKIESDKFGRFNNKKILVNIPREEFLSSYRKGFEKMFGESLLEDENDEPSNKKATEIISIKEISETFIGCKLYRDFSTDLDYNIAICILALMKENRKTGINITEIFIMLGKYDIDCTGLNFSEWCSKNEHFRCVNNQVQLKPGSYCEKLISKKPILSKKEEVEKKKVEELESFHILTENKLTETDYLKFEKKVHELSAYRCYVDFNDPKSIQSAYELLLTIGKDNVLGEKVIEKLCNTVLNAIEAYISNE
jgi:hypothetical protein